MMLSRRLRLVAFFLPLAGLILIMPPIVFLFDRPGSILGIPSIIAFLFAVWLVLVVAAYFMQRALSRVKTLPQSDSRRTDQDP